MSVCSLADVPKYVNFTADSLPVAKAEELALYGAGSHSVDVGANFKAGVAHVIDDAYGEVVLRADSGHVGEDGFSMAGVNSLEPRP